MKAVMAPIYRAERKEYMVNTDSKVYGHLIPGECDEDGSYCTSETYIVESYRKQVDNGVAVKSPIEISFDGKTWHLLSELEDYDKLKYYKDTTIGTFTTDRPDVISTEIKDKYFWELNYDK